MLKTAYLKKKNYLFFKYIYASKELLESPGTFSISLSQIRFYSCVFLKHQSILCNLPMVVPCE